MYGRFERKDKTPGQRAYQASQPKSQQLAQPKTPPLSGAPIKMSPKAPPVANVPPQNVQQAPQRQQPAQQARPAYPNVAKIPRPQAPTPQQVSMRQQALIGAPRAPGGMAMPTAPPPAPQMLPQQMALMGGGPSLQMPRPTPQAPMPYMGNAMFMSQQPGLPGNAGAMFDWAASQTPSAAGGVPHADFSRMSRDGAPGAGRMDMGQTPESGTMTPEQMAQALNAFGDESAAASLGAVAGLGAIPADQMAAIEALIGPNRIDNPLNPKPFGEPQSAESKMGSDFDRGYTNDPTHDAFSDVAGGGEYGWNLDGSPVDETGKPPEMTPMEAEYYGQEDKLKNLLGYTINDLLSDETPSVFSPEELAQQALEIDKGTQSAQSAVSQQMGARGFGASGVAGANLGNIAAAGEAAKTQLMVDDRIAGIEAQMNKLNQVSSLFGHLLSEEQRMEIAEMQEQLQRDKFDAERSDVAQANDEMRKVNIAASIGAPYYTPKAAAFVDEMIAAGATDAEIYEALGHKGPDAAAYIATPPEDAPEGYPDWVPATTLSEAESQREFSQARGWDHSPPEYSDAPWDSLNEDQKRLAWDAYVNSYGAEG